MADAQQQIKKLMTLIADDPNPSKIVYETMKREEARAAGYSQQIEVENQIVGPCRRRWMGIQNFASGLLAT